MNEYLIAVIIGIIEGLTEFLPVSSTAHIRITQDLLNVDLASDYWKMFAIVIQLGAILSVVVYFWNRIIKFVRSYPHGEVTTASGSDLHDDEQGKLTEPSQNVRRTTWWNHPLALVILSSFVTGVPCYLIDKKIGENLESLKIIGWALLIGGVLMWVIDRIFSQRAVTHVMDHITPRQAIVIGFAQIFAAAFPGTSRSMATIAGGQIMGLSRPAALEFSFFLSIPIMCAATGFKLLQFVTKYDSAITAHQWGVLAVGFVVSFLVAWACIAWFMGWVKKRGFVPFAIYRIIIGAIILVWAYRATGGSSV